VNKGVTVTTAVASQAGATIQSLTETLVEAAQAATQIVASAGQQSIGMSQINQAMKNLEQVARQNLAAIRQIEQAARDLNALGTQLANLTM
jgi:methyl-accepting chemotaxis protein